MGINKKIYEWIFILIFTQIVLVLLSIYDILLLLLNVPDIVISIFLFPLAEELYKYFFAKKFNEKIFPAIVIFSISELIFVKVPLIDLSDYNGEYFLLLAPLVSMNFHISTAFVYKSHAFIVEPKLTFFCMFILHVIYNSVSLLNISTTALLIVAVIASVAPLIWLYRSSRTLKPKGPDLE